MGNHNLEIEIHWRDENYGSVTAAAAFRNYAPTSDWSHADHARFVNVLKRCGFAVNHARCSYIASEGDPTTLKMQLCRELKAAGFTITHGDQL